MPGTDFVLGTPFCVRDLLTLGRNASLGSGDALAAVLQYAVAGDARIETPYAGVGDL